VVVERENSWERQRQRDSKEKMVEWVQCWLRKKEREEENERSRDFRPNL